MKNINEIVDPRILEYVNKKFKGQAVLSGRRALALAGITFKRPITKDNDYDFCIRHLPVKLKVFGGLKKAGGTDGDGYKITDDEELEGIDHYYFNWNRSESKFVSFSEMEPWSVKTRNCLFVNPNINIIEIEGIKIADPEQILFYKRKYVKTSAKHAQDFKNMVDIRYRLNNL